MIEYISSKFENHERFYTLFVLNTMQDYVCFDPKKKIKYVTAKELTRLVNHRLKGTDVPRIKEDHTKKILHEAYELGTMRQHSLSKKSGIYYEAYCPNWFLYFDHDTDMYKYTRPTKSIMKKKRW